MSIFSMQSDIYREISETVEVPEAKLRLLRYFDLLPEEEDHDEELGDALIKIFKSGSEEVKQVLYLTEIGYSTLILLSSSLTPQFWTNQNVRLIKIRHAEILRTTME